MDVDLRPQLNGTKPLATNRLNLRPFKRRDAGAVVSWSHDENVLRYLITPITDETGAEVEIAAWRVQYNNPTFMHWCIAEADNDNCIGFIDATPDEHLSAAEISYAISPEKRGMGYASEALDEVIRYLHEECHIHRISAEVNTENISSTCVVEKSGMELEGILRDALANRNGEFYDVAVFSHLA